MHYGEGALWSPLFEMAMEPLQVACGCSYNRCRFCDMYHQPFAPSPQAEIDEDIREIATRSPNVHRIFLTGGNALTLPFDDLAGILREIAAVIGPGISVGCFARITDIMRKSDEQLAELADLGMDDISIGAETGYEPALEFMRKGYTADDIVEQCARLDKAGMAYDFFYLIGMAGKGACVDAARASARVFDETRPKRIMVHTMTPFEGTDLQADIESGAFEQAGEIEILQELREFIALIHLDTFILGGHISNTAPLEGFVPRQRQAMLDALDFRIEHGNEKAMAHFRAALRSI